MTTATAEKKSFEEFSAEFDKKQEAARLWAVKEGYALSGLKVFEAGSEETTCFVSNITKNGKKVGDAKNDGHGGSTMVWVKGLNHEDSEKLEIWVDSEVEEQSVKKEKAKAVTKAKQWAKRKGMPFLAMKWMSDIELSYVGGKTEASLLTYTSTGYTLIAL